MRRLAQASSVLVAAIAIGGTGCDDGTDLFGLGLGGDGEGAGEVTPASADASQACPPGQVEAPSAGEDASAARETEPLDPATLPACAPVCGGAHCVPKDDVPEASRPYFATCGAGYCLPDALIRSGGAKPPSCTSLGAAPGVCLSTCVPLVAENQDILPKAGCREGERCAPCTNPNDGKPTGACAIGTQKTNATPKRCVPKEETLAPGSDAQPGAPPACPHVGAPVIVASTLPACGAADGGAHCLPEKNVPQALVAELATCGTSGRCVPDKLIESGGRFIPKTCASALGAEGRCQSMAVPSVAAQATLPIDVCDANERCVPCFNPVDGTPTGACTTSCDGGPKAPAKLFPSCCGSEGKCVPTSLVPPAQRASLDACAQDSLCVPTEHLNPAFVPQKCSGEIFFDDYDGVCLNDRCLDLGSSAWLLDDGNCPNGKTCVPCTRNGEPTGAPGCAP